MIPGGHGRRGIVSDVESLGHSFSVRSDVGYLAIVDAYPDVSVPVRAAYAVAVSIGDREIVQTGRNAVRYRNVGEESVGISSYHVDDGIVRFSFEEPSDVSSELIGFDFDRDRVMGWVGTSVGLGVPVDPEEVGFGRVRHGLVRWRSRGM